MKLKRRNILDDAKQPRMPHGRQDAAPQGFIERVVIPLIRSFAELILISIVVLAIGVAAYALFDLFDIGAKAQPANWAKYKPGEEKPSFEDLVAINPEVIGWIQLYGTNVDYPVVQAKDNEKYLTTSPDLKYSLSGSVFLDYRNSPHFTDFNNIVHGHSMSYNAMFGDISDFAEASFFKEHRYGDLFFDGTHHGLRIIGMVEADGYKSGLYRPYITSDEEKDELLQLLAKESMHKIPKSDLSRDNTYVLLSTCVSSMTNGRYVLACVLTDEVYENTFGDDTNTNDTVGGPVLRLRLFLLVMCILLVLICASIVMRRLEQRSGGRATQGQEHRADDASDA